jgi:hypothetical protein
VKGPMLTNKTFVSCNSERLTNRKVLIFSMHCRDEAAQSSVHCLDVATQRWNIEVRHLPLIEIICDHPLTALRIHKMRVVRIVRLHLTKH